MPLHSRDTGHMIPVRTRDTIVALSTPPPAWHDSAQKCDIARAIIRLSGPQALALPEKVFKSAEPAGRTWRRITGHVPWPNHALAAALYIIRAPRSSTREDMPAFHLPPLAPPVS